ncbi:MAG: peptide chain release factor 2 [Candidatus Dojkabacteria bacterium]|nr:peptide chain release factor 2 [Candidatus Dojkabacteria bacterium]
MTSNFRVLLSDLKNRFLALYKKKNISQLKNKLVEIQASVMKKDFWENNTQAQATMQMMSEIQKDLETFVTLEKRLNDIEDLLLDSDTGDESVKDLVKEELQEIEIFISELEKLNFLSGKFDKCSAVMKILAGQGGTEACDWASMVFRMYTQYATRKGWEIIVVNTISGNETGFDSIEFVVKGEYAYGMLKHEHGVHRLVRNSPFNAQNLRQTSFVGVEVIPLVNEEIEIVIRDEDIEFYALRSSGPGGQNVNKVSSKVRIIHKPTGLVVECDSERSQQQNREIAMKILKARLYEIEQAKKKKEINSIKGDYKIAGWGNQIRNYVLQPYKLVKDLRTNVETTNAEAVLNGDLDLFIDAEVRLLS